MNVLVQARPIERAPVATRGELLAWGALLAGALLLRVARLGDPPLDPDEARRALEGWDLWRTGRVDYQAGPLLSNVLSGVFGLFTAGDGQARLPSALAGTALVAVPWLLRPALGAGTAWCAGLILALGPPFVLASRTAGPAILVALFVLLTAACADRFARADEGGRWLVGGLTSALLGLAADPSFTVAIGGAGLALVLAEGDLRARPAWWPTARRWGPRALATALLIALAFDTRLLMNPNGVQAGLVDSLWRWSTDVVRGGGLIAPLLLVLIDGGALLLALIGLADYRRHRRAVRLLGAWLVVSLALVTLLRQPDLRYLVHPLVPAALLGGLGLRRLSGAVRRRGSLRTAVLGLALFAPLVTAGFQINAGLRANQDPWAGAALVALVGLLIVALAGLSWLRPAELPAALAGFLLVALSLWTVTTASRLLEARGSARAHLLQSATLTEEVETVRGLALKWYRADPNGPIPVDPALRPLVAWSLRDVPTVRYEDAAGRPGVPRLLAEAPAAAGPDARVTRLVIGYAADRATLELGPARVWRWVVGRANLVEVRPYAILVAQPAGP